MASFGVLGAFVFALTRDLGSVVVTTSAFAVPWHTAANFGLVAGAGGTTQKSPIRWGQGFAYFLSVFSMLSRAYSKD